MNGSGDSGFTSDGAFPFPADPAAAAGRRARTAGGPATAAGAASPSACRPLGPGLVPGSPCSSQPFPPPGSSLRSSGSRGSGGERPRPGRCSTAERLRPSSTARRGSPREGSGRAPVKDQPEERRGYFAGMATFPLPVPSLPAALLEWHVKAQGSPETGRGLGEDGCNPTALEPPPVLLSAASSAFPRLIQRSSLSPKPAS